MPEILATGPGHLWLLLLALAVDAIVGDPDWLWRRLPHPVVVLGRAIEWLESRLNRDGASDVDRKLAGCAAVAALVIGAGGIGWAVHRIILAVPGAWIIELAVVAALLAQRSLYQHVAAVAKALEEGGLEAGRRAVSRIVGRDPASLDEAGVARGAIESCVESLGDGVVAPAFWYAALGLPGILAYKAINTADSMIGHRTPRYRAFGWASARIDDLVNLIPARLSGAFAIAAAFLVSGPQAAGRAFRIVMRDAPRHRSPNAGWPEAAVAGALGLALAGPRRYADGIVDDAWMGEGGRREAQSTDIRRALRLFAVACLVMAGTLAVGAVAAG